MSIGVPLQWVESSGFHRGQINIVPLTAAFQGSGFLPPSQSSGGAAFLQILGTKNWIPYYWELLYVSGFPDGVVPILINELIGNYTAKMILELLAASNKIPNYSLSIDNVSQSINTSGPNVYDVRLAQIDRDIESLVDRIQKRILSFTLRN